MLKMLKQFFNAACYNYIRTFNKRKQQISIDFKDKKAHKYHKINISKLETWVSVHMSACMCL